MAPANLTLALGSTEPSHQISATARAGTPSSGSRETTRSCAGALIARLVALLMTLAHGGVRFVRNIVDQGANQRSRDESSRDESSGERRFGPYTLGEKIGEGGMAAVYKAHHAELDRTMAIKVLPAERAGGRELERFEREVRLTSKLTHPNTISIYDFGRTAEGTFYYAMEYLEGRDLQALVDEVGPLPPARAAHLLAQVCGALDEAHRAGLLHRDIKPANVFVCENDRAIDAVKVLDFGLIKEMGAPRSKGLATEAGTIVGTPMYMPPEAVTAPETMDGRSDLYAVGALGYFLLTGAPPFAGKTLLEVCCQHLHDEPVPPSERAPRSIPPALEDLVLACLAKSPEDRPRDAASLRAALLSIAEGWTLRDEASPRLLADDVASRNRTLESTEVQRSVRQAA